MQRSLYIFSPTAFPHGLPTSCVNGRLISKQEGKSKSDPPLQMRRRFLVLYNREEKAGGLAEMQVLLA